MAKIVKIKQSDIEKIVFNLIKENWESDDYAPDPDSEYEDRTHIDDEPNDIEHQDDIDDISKDVEGEPYWTGDYVNVNGTAYQIVIGSDGRIKLYDKNTDNTLSTEESMMMLKQGKRMSSDTEGESNDEDAFTVNLD